MSFGRDRIGSCSNYYNKYDTRYDHNLLMKKTRIENSKDSLSSQAYLEKELLKRMQDGYFKLPNGRLLYVIKIGKEVLVLLMVPTFFMFFKFPKWVFMQAMPVLAKGLKKGGKRLKTALNQLILSRMAEITKKIAENMANLAKKTSEVLNSAVKFFDPLKKIPEKLKLKMDQTLEALAKAYDVAMAPYRKVVAFAKKTSQNIQDFGAYISAQMTKVLSPFRKAASWLKDKGNAVNAFSKKVVETVNKRVIEPAKRFKNKISELTKKIAKPIAEAFEPVRKLVEQVRTISWNVIEVIKAREQVLREWVQNAGSNLVRAYQGTIEMVMPFAKRFIGGIQGISFKINMEPTINFIKATIRVGQFLKEKGKSAAQWMMSRIKKVKHQLARALDWTVVQAFKIPGLVWGFIQGFVLIIGEAFKRIFFMLRLILAWVRVLVRFTFIELRSKLAN